MGKRRNKLKLPSMREKNENGMRGKKKKQGLLAVSHEILPSTDFCRTKHVLALGAPSRRDLHYEQGLMKEELRGLRRAGFQPSPFRPDMKEHIST